MRKEEISAVLLHLWNNVDQAGFDGLIKEALRNCPISVQKKLIGDLLAGRSWDGNPDEETLETAKRLVGYTD
ncbi:hypothetical protein ACFVS2_25405 [Brevibacillus sp. NPDC058079]|uniref:hypothetical protein n=1 Tax=Brevibacillus sp. NPDC058079 TaxID=3346330 RepID=UPI0036EA84ED